MKKSILASVCISMIFCSAVGFAATDKTVPSLKIKVGCNEECNITRSVQTLIIAAYTDKAEIAGYKIDDTKTNELTITNFRARSATARLLFGAMAGADVIEGYIKSPDGKQVEIKDMAIMAKSTISDVAQIVGEQTFDETVKFANSSPSEQNVTK
jgi:hypothetical protein